MHKIVFHIIKIKILICIVLLTNFSALFAENLISSSFESFSFSAQINNSKSVNAEISSCLDNNNITHIVWIKNDGTNRFLMYTKFSPVTKQFSTVQLEAGTKEMKIAPKIITDSNNNPHIVYIMKRDPNGGTNNGNFAVMYVGDGNGDGVFDILQVSTNPKDKNATVNNIYNCYVNDRPSIMLIDKDIYISYISETSSLTTNKIYLIFAKKNGNSWSHSQEINLYGNDVGGYNVDYGVSFPAKASSIKYGGLVDLSKYIPRIIYKANAWNVLQIPGYSGTLGTNKHVSIVIDNNQKNHFMWYNTQNKKFCHTVLSDYSYGAIDEYSVLSSSAGNLFPATVDLSTGLPIYFYNKSAEEAKIIIGTQEIEIKNIGNAYGKEALHAQNGYISMTTASQSNQKIYVSTNTLSASSVADLSLQKVSVYPNPTSSYIKIQGIDGKANLDIYSLEGKLLLENEFEGNESISVANLPIGLYLLKIKTDKNIIERKIIKI